MDTEPKHYLMKLFRPGVGDVFQIKWADFFYVFIPNMSDKYWYTTKTDISENDMITGYVPINHQELELIRYDPMSCYKFC